ncbi:MAG TPA: PH domain-containing protein [Thermoanaerobaculia bacterium]|nr:PH domain-containing protein [Thermoanaerobaculia bacterium]
MTASEQPAQPILPLLEEGAGEITPPLPSIADGVEHLLDPRHVTLSRIVRWLGAGAVSLGSLVPLGSIVFFASIPGWVTGILPLLWVVGTLGLAWSAHRWPVIEHRHASYKVDDNGIQIRQGVVWRKEINVPRSRVQHTDVSQGPLERRFGLGTLVIYTAGTDHAKIELHGLDHATALAIRDHLVHGEGDAV